MTDGPIGVLALQGDVREHRQAVAAVGERTVAVRTPTDLAAVRGLIIPGGESTTIGKLAAAFGLLEPLRQAVRDGLPVFGSCAGLVMLAGRVVDGVPGQDLVGGLDVTVRRNAFGGQVYSFETELSLTGVPGGLVQAVFIRAPRVEVAGPGVQVLATLDGGDIVAVRQGPILATSFHPELTGDDRLHRFFLEEFVTGNRNELAAAAP